MNVNVVEALEEKVFEKRLLATATAKATANGARAMALTKEALTALHSLFPNTIIPALDIVDQRWISEITCPAGRSLFQVRGKGGRAYLVLPEQNYCDCVAFEYQVLRMEHTMVGFRMLNPSLPKWQCKHLLSVRLARAFERDVAADAADDRSMDVGNNEEEDAEESAAIAGRASRSTSLQPQFIAREFVDDLAFAKRMCPADVALPQLAKD